MLVALPISIMDWWIILTHNWIRLWSYSFWALHQLFFLFFFWNIDIWINNFSIICNNKINTKSCLETLWYPFVLDKMVVLFGFCFLWNFCSFWDLRVQLEAPSTDAKRSTELVTLNRYNLFLIWLLILWNHQLFLESSFWFFVQK